MSQKSTTDLSEGTNLYYTEARVQDKLDNAFEQLTAMLNNLANTTTLVLNLSGDPTPGDVTAFNNASLSGGTGYNTTTSVATTSNGSGTGLLVDITASGGVITAVGIRSGGLVMQLVRPLQSQVVAETLLSMFLLLLKWQSEIPSLAVHLAPQVSSPLLVQLQ